MPRTKEQAKKEAPPEAKAAILQPRRVATQWVKGEKGNKNLYGMSNKDAAQGRLNAKTALRVRGMLLDTLESQIATMYAIIYDPEATEEEVAEARAKIIKFINADVNTMLRDAEHRGLGAPKQEIKIESEAKPIRDMTDDELEELIIDAQYQEIEHNGD